MPLTICVVVLIYHSSVTVEQELQICDPPILCCGVNRRERIRCPLVRHTGVKTGYCVQRRQHTEIPQPQFDQHRGHVHSHDSPVHARRSTNRNRTINQNVRTTGISERQWHVQKLRLFAS